MTMDEDAPRLDPSAISGGKLYYDKETKSIKAEPSLRQQIKDQQAEIERLKEELEKITAPRRVGEEPTTPELKRRMDARLEFLRKTNHPPWKCFHCGQWLHSEAEAKKHFG